MLTWAGGEVAGGRGEKTVVLREGGGDGLRALGRLLMGLRPSPGLDWEAIEGLAWRHGLAALMYWRLDESEDGWDGVPEVIRDGLRDAFYAAAARAMVAERLLAEALKVLAAAEVPVLLVKGAALGAFYPDPALRAYGDFDIMVSQAQLDRVEQVLNGLGYRCYSPKAWWSKQHQHMPPMVSGDGWLMVEVHWRLDREEVLGRLPAEDLWARAVPWSVAGQPALQLEIVDAALHLCRHAVVQHRLRLGLRPLCDLAQVTGGWDQAEWQVLSRRAMRYGLERSVYLMLVLAEQVLGLAVPPHVMSALRPFHGESVPEDLGENLLHLGDSQTLSVPVAAVQAGAKGTRRAQLRHLLWHLFLPRDGMAVVYDVPADSPRIWLMYLRRPADLLRRYGRSAWDALRGEGAARAAWAREVWLERWLRGESETGGPDGVEQSSEEANGRNID